MLFVLIQFPDSAIHKKIGQTNCQQRREQEEKQYLISYSPHPKYGATPVYPWLEQNKK